MKALVGLLCCLWCMVVWAGDGATINRVARALENTPLQRKLNSLVITELNVERAPLKDVIALIQLRAQRGDPDNEKINFLVLLKPEAQTKEITLSLDQVPVGEAVRYVCMAAGVKYRVEPHAVVIHDGAEDVQTRIYNVPPDSPLFQTKKTREGGKFE